MNYKSMELIKNGSEIESHLTDDLSKQIYNIRLNYFFSKNVDELQKDILELNQENTQRPLFFDELLKNNDNVKNVVIFGAGNEGKKIAFNLHHSKYCNKNIVFCDNNSNSQTYEGGGYTANISSRVNGQLSR